MSDVNATPVEGNVVADAAPVSSVPAPSATAPDAVSTGDVTASVAAVDTTPSSPATPEGTSQAQPTILEKLEALPADGAAFVHDLLAHIEHGFESVSLSHGMSLLKDLRAIVAKL